MEVLLVGLSHKTAPVEIRERLAIDPRDLIVHRRVLDLPGVDECVILSTCNRTEIYAATERDSTVDALTGYLASQAGLGAAELSQHLFVRTGERTARHLFRVASGLDSMILGETQILGQVKNAYLEARRAGATGKVMNALWERALRIGKLVRTETSISHNAVSVSYAAVELARKVYDGFAGRTVLVLGAGKMGTLAAQYFAEQKPARLLVANRTLARAEEVAEMLGGVPVDLAALPSYLGQADVVIASITSAAPVITEAMVRSIMPARRGRPLFMVDIAVPRNIDPAVGKLPGVFLYDIDDLQNVVAANLKEREAAVSAAEALIEQEVASFSSWFKELQAIPVIKTLYERAEAVRQAEVERALRRLGPVSPREEEIIEALTKSIVQKLLHDPVKAIKQLAAGEHAEEGLLLAKDLFNLDDVLAAARDRSTVPATGGSRPQSVAGTAEGYSE